MKIAELWLRAFGPFSGVQLDLDGGQEGLHIVYGDNAAGKSSALRAITGMLFGIPQQTGDDHVHAYADLRVGGRLRNAAGAELEFLRRKAKKRSLITANGEALGDDALDPFLAGMSAARFLSAHGIDHERLIEGGRNILEGRGEVGEILVESGLGGARLRQTREQLQRSAEALFTPTASKRPINAGIRRWETATKAARELALPPARWLEASAALERATADRAVVEDERREVAVQAARAQRMGKVLPLVAQLRALDRDLNDIGREPVLPPGAAQERQSALRALDVATQSVARSRRSIEAWGVQRDAIAVPTGLLDRVEEVEALHDHLADYVSASQQLPSLDAVKARAVERAETLLAELRPGTALAEAPAILPSPALREQVDVLAEQLTELSSRRSVLDEALATAARELELVDEKLAEVAGATEPTEMKAFLRRAQVDAHIDRDLARAEADARKASRSAEEVVSSLGADLAVADLRGLPVPLRASVERFRVDEDGLDATLTRARDRVDELERRRARLQRAQDDLHSAGEVPTDNDLRRARRQRNRGWALVREHWLDGGALGGRAPDMFEPDRAMLESYEASVHEADEISDRLRRDADRVARTKSLSAEQRELSSELFAAQRVLRDVEADVGGHRVRWRNAWASVPVAVETPREMLGWLDRYTAACAALEAAADARRVASELEARRDRIRTEARTLIDVSDSPVASIVDRLSASVDAAERRNQLRVRLEQARDDDARKVAAAKARRAAAGDALEVWRRSWSELMQAVDLPAETSVERARAVLASYDELSRCTMTAAEATVELGALCSVVAAFTKRATEVATQVAPDLVDKDPDEAAAALYARCQRAGREQDLRRNLGERITHAESEIAEAEATIASERQRLRRLVELAQVDAVDALPTAEAQSERRGQLLEERRALVGQLLAVGDGRDVDAILTEARDVDRDALDRQRIALGRRADELDATASRLDQDIGAMRVERDKMDGTGDAADAAQEAESIAAEVVELAARHAHLRLAAGLLRKHIERYRRDHEGPLVSHAAKLFAKMTLGELVRLETALDDAGRPIIYGVRRSDVRVGVAGMSDGTRDQLYLALRLAALHHQLDRGTGEPMPFIVDDVLVGLDDRRASATLAVLAALSDRTQVLFFTHHRRLVELAEQTAPERVFVHRLGSVPEEALSVANVEGLEHGSVGL